MILEGAKLMVIGMIIVYIFLLVLMLTVMLSAKLFKDSAASAPPGMKPPARSPRDVVPVIAAAVAAYRVRRSRDG